MDAANFEKLCRICLELPLEPTSLQETLKANNEIQYSAFIHQLTNLEINDYDELPGNLCETCVRKLSETFDLIHLAVKSDEELRTHLLFKNTYETSEEVVATPPEVTNLLSEKYQCSECGVKFSNKTKFKKHLKTHDCSNQYKCDECLQTFSKPLHLKVHLRSHVKDEDKKFACQHCEKQFSYEYLLKRHEYKHSDDKPFPCMICDKGCLTALSLKRHMKIHDANYAKKKHKCKDCDKEFEYPSFLAEHMKNHTGEKPHLCSHCGKGFRQRGALHYHQRIHTGYKPFQCKICLGNFMSQSVLKVHMRKHTNERPYVCQICGAAFRQCTDLKSHQRTHSGDRPVLCTICGKRMSTTGQLTIHLRSHTGEKPFPCSHCSKSFTTRTMMLKHERIHTGEKPYVCDVCGKAFNQSSTLRTHKNTHQSNRKRKKPETNKSVDATTNGTKTVRYILTADSIIDKHEQQQQEQRAGENPQVLYKTELEGCAVQTEILVTDEQHFVVHNFEVTPLTHKDIEEGEEVKTEFVILPAPIPLLQNL